MLEKNVPRDFFLHTGAFISLYLGAVALITILFSIINYVFFDPLSGYYNDPYSGPMRFAIASLIILTPLTVYLFFKIQGESRITPERRTLSVRKWLTYITLFVAGLTVIGDLILLMDSFLGGALPTPFALKVSVILVVMGAGFGYFFLDIKGYWEKNAHHSRYVGMAIVLSVIASIVGGMLLIGSPMTQRALREDAEQVYALMTIQNAVNQYWSQTRALPENLVEMENDFTGFRIPESPEGRAAYSYEKTSTSTYELCADFTLPTPEERAQFEVGQYGESWAHEAGLHCFTRAVDPRLLPPEINLEAVTAPKIK